MTFQMNLNPWARCEGYAECERALELNSHQVLFECGHGKYWYLGDRVLPQVEHVYPPAIIPTPLCLTVRLADFLANEEITRARDGYVIAGVEGNYAEFIWDRLQGCLVGRTVFLFPSNYCFTNSFSIFLLVNNICMLNFQPPSYEGEEAEEEEIPSLAQISILALLLSSEVHREVLLKVLKEMHVPTIIIDSSFEGMISLVLATNQV